MHTTRRFAFGFAIAACFSKQVFDLEFFATDASGFIPVYLSDVDSAIG
jgi:hypothetical protein